MATDFKVPDLGENVDEGDIVKVMVKEGDVITPDQGVMEIETGKAVVELPCPLGGKITKVHVQEGAKVKVGDSLLTIEASDGDARGDHRNEAAGTESGRQSTGEEKSQGEAAGRRAGSGCGSRSCRGGSRSQTRQDGSENGRRQSHDGTGDRAGQDAAGRTCHAAPGTRIGRGPDGSAGVRPERPNHRRRYQSGSARNGCRGAAPAGAERHRYPTARTKKMPGATCAGRRCPASARRSP